MAVDRPCGSVIVKFIWMFVFEKAAYNSIEAGNYSKSKELNSEKKTHQAVRFYCFAFRIDYPELSPAVIQKTFEP
ncbi:MAG: hypothetical protein V7731_00365 [Amphritea sp.]